ncbi:PREDICTED: uncharacterized protein LOC106815105 [Priapulus caudatus]|uniref:Uncharacterized protein LOC106815105 n=1 Tax=Priapulus caudatus TaxID=37621 RepID=A0ABM1ES46_PRICU|nr:PREDICTED: uncharacterized protein LOC106815105 [Priapulus caudatus]
MVTLWIGEAFDVLEVATDQRHLVDSLLGKMADIPRLSMPHLLQLQSELHELQNSFSKQDIAEAVKVLQDARVKQGRFLEYMRERASQAKGQIDGLKRLRSLRTQFN